jgi:Lon protease-like protein
MPDRFQSEFPLFALELVALPNELVPLHIFEQRYRVMIEHCLVHESEFGVLWVSDDEIKQVGCTCEIDQVLERTEDGRLNILARGVRPFRLVQREGDLAYPAGKVEFLSEHDEQTDLTGANTTRELYGELFEQATDQTIAPEDLASMNAYEMAATVDFGSDAKQELLELRSENARLRLLTLLLRAAIKRLQLVERAQTRARSNGKVRFG